MAYHIVDVQSMVIFIIPDALMWEEYNLVESTLTVEIEISRLRPTAACW
jgi:hypothetical protein